MSTIESKVADAILQKKGEIELDGITWQYEQPTVATLIMVSQLASELPSVDMNKPILYEVLTKGKDTVNIGKIAATLILGAKRIRENRRVEVVTKTASKRFSWRKLRMVRKQVVKVTTEPEMDVLVRSLLDLSPNDFNMLVYDRLNEMEVGAFFSITTSLKGINLLRSTREVETASGD